MVLAKIDDQVVGFLSLKKHSEYAYEIYVMGVSPEYHRSGIGKELIKATEQYLRQLNVEFLQVKTLSSERENEAYRKTRLFYKNCGFRQLEVFPDLWDKDNPCLLMIKNIIG